MGKMKEIPFEIYSIFFHLNGSKINASWKNV